MLRRLGILGPIVWAAYWGDSDLVDCECLWVLKGELAKLYDYLNAGIASETGMPELQSSSFVKLASDSASITVKPKSSQGSPFRRLRHAPAVHTTIAKKNETTRLRIRRRQSREASFAAYGRAEHTPEPRRHRPPKRQLNNVAESSQVISR